jgi:hypothetical protein
MKNNTITIKNELPELLEAVCEHPKCPEWLKHDIWDSFTEHHGAITYKADWWRAILVDAPMYDPRERIAEQQRERAEQELRLVAS